MNALFVSFSPSAPLALLGLSSPTSSGVSLPARGGQTHDLLIFHTFAAAILRLSHRKGGGRRLRLCRLRLCRCLLRRSSTSSSSRRRRRRRRRGRRRRGRRGVGYTSTRPARQTCSTRSLRPVSDSKDTFKGQTEPESKGENHGGVRDVRTKRRGRRGGEKGFERSQGGAKELT